MTDWTNSTLLEILKMAATPIIFDQLIVDGVLRKHGAKYEVLDLAPTRVREAENTPWHDFSQDEQPRGFVHKAKQANVWQAKKIGLLPPD